LAVLRPLKVVLTNYPEHFTEELDAVNNPKMKRRQTQGAVQPHSLH